MLEQLFGSSTRVRLLRLFLHHPEQPFFVRELTRRISAQINAVRNELDNLSEMGILEICEAPVLEGGTPAEPPQVSDVEAANGDAVRPVDGQRHVVEAVSRPEAAGGKRRKYYRLNAECLLYPELKQLFLKSRVLLEKDFVGRLAKCGQITYMAMTGHFVGATDMNTDLLIVGRLQKDKFLPLLRAFEREIGREINYTVMSPQEYRYRRDVTDRFLYSVLDGKKIVVVDMIAELARAV